VRLILLESIKRKAIYFKILNYQSDNLELLRHKFELCELDDPSELTAAYLAECEILFAPLGYFYGADIINQSPKLKVIATNTTGVPHIDCELAQQVGIQVISLKDQADFLKTITPTAEHTWGLLLALSRHTVSASQFVEQGEWGRWAYSGRSMLSQMSIGIVGLGRVGSMVARYAQAFGMNVAYFDPHNEENEEVSYTQIDSLIELVASVDIVSLHVHATEENLNMFDAKVFKHFQNGSYFINTARGELVDSESLIFALDQKWISAAALDVLDGEYVPGFEKRAKLHPLIEYAKDHDNLLITPHIAGSTRDAWYLTQKNTIKMVLEYLHSLEEGNLKSA